MTTNTEEMQATLTFTIDSATGGMYVEMALPDDYDPENPRDFELGALACMGFLQELRDEEVDV